MTVSARVVFGSAMCEDPAVIALCKLYDWTSLQNLQNQSAYSHKS